MQSWLSFLAALLLAPCVAQAHVALDSPNGGESLTGGETFLIEWHPEAEHELVDWDLWYSTTSSSGPWIDIAANLTIDSGSPLSHEWITPNSDFSEVWVRVQQDNVEEDYTDESDASFSITAAGVAGDYNGDGMVDAADYTEWLDNLGNPAGLPNGNNLGTVGQSHYDLWKTSFSNVSGSGTSAPVSVPEPTTGYLLLVGMGGILIRWRLAMRI